MKAIQKVLVGMALLIAAPTFGEGIDWHGDWKITHTLRSVYIPIIGNIDETSGNLTLEFVEDLGKVWVTVTDKQGNTVYQESIGTGETPNLTIPLGTVAEGTVSVTDGENLVYSIINY